MCGICALLITEVLSNYKNEKGFMAEASRFKILTTFIVELTFSVST